MRPIDMYRLIGLTPKRTCSEKKLYSLREDAAKAAREHNQRLVCGAMVEYWCGRHLGWHIGHNDKRWSTYQMMLGYIMWFKAWEAETKRASQRPL